MTDPRAIARAFDLKRLDPAFLDDPFPVYRALREHDPVHHMPDGSYFLSRAGLHAPRALMALRPRIEALVDRLLDRGGRPDPARGGSRRPSSHARTAGGSVSTSPSSTSPPRRSGRWRRPAPPASTSTE
jgi:cytochrome P450